MRQNKGMLKTPLFFYKQCPESDKKNARYARSKNIAHNQVRHSEQRKTLNHPVRRTSTQGSTTTGTNTLKNLKKRWM